MTAEQALAIAAAIERGISGQVALITSLSLAIIGGMLALMVQIKMHNADKSKRAITLDGPRLVGATIILAGLAIAIGFLITGMLIEIAPPLFGSIFIRTKSFSDQSLVDAPFGALRALSLGQAAAFLGAVICGAIVVRKNQP